MKRFALLFVVLLVSCAIGRSQGVRFSATVTQQGTVGSSTNVVVLPASPIVTFCQHPANAVPCSNKATTYTDQTLATPCSAATQIVRDGTSTCIATPDAQNNWGVWVAPNSAGYDYTITIGATSTGPFNVLSETTTHNQSETFVAPGVLNSNNLAAGNVGNKSSVADGYQYVSNGGNDANDGLSPGTAKLTVGAACAALPGGNGACTAGAGAIFTSPTFSGTLTQPTSTSISILTYSASGSGGGHNWYAKGVFDSSNMYELNEADINGTSAKTEFQTVQGGLFATDALSGAISVPSGALQHNINAVAGYINTSADSSLGNQANAVAFYGQCRILATNAACWGANPVIVGTAGKTGQRVAGIEVDINIAGTFANGAYKGFYLTGLNGGGTLGTNSNGFEVGLPYQLSGGFVCDRGSCNLGAQFNDTLTTNPSQSQEVQFVSHDSGGTQHVEHIFADQFGDIVATPESQRSLIIPAQSGLQFQEGTVPLASTAYDVCYGDSTAHAVKCSYNNGSFFGVPLVGIANTFTAAQTIGAGGSLNATALLISPTAPTIAAAGCGGGAASISNNNGTAAFEVNVGTTPGSACTITMPAAAHKWICTATDFTTNSTSVFLQKQSPVASQTTTQVVITNFSDVAAATTFVANDIMGVSCHAY